MSTKNTEQLNADTLFAFTMALKGHKQFEWHDGMKWLPTEYVNSLSSFRIFHDIPEGWTRHDGEDWKGDKDVVIEEVIWCDGQRCQVTDKKASWWANVGVVNNWTTETEGRIYAYKLAAKSPAIPEGFTKHDGVECPVSAETKVELIYKCGAIETRNSSKTHWPHTNDQKDVIAYRVIEKKVIPWTVDSCPPLPFEVVVKDSKSGYTVVERHSDGYRKNNDQHQKPWPWHVLLENYTMRDGSVCGTEVEQ